MSFITKALKMEEKSSLERILEPFECEFFFFTKLSKAKYVHRKFIRSPAHAFCTVVFAHPSCFYIKLGQAGEKHKSIENGRGGELQRGFCGFAPQGGFSRLSNMSFITKVLKMEEEESSREDSVGFLPREDSRAFGV